jgi:hypothetical protein
VTGIGLKIWQGVKIEQGVVRPGIKRSPAELLDNVWAIVVLFTRHEKELIPRADSSGMYRAGIHEVFRAGFAQPPRNVSACRPIWGVFRHIDKTYPTYPQEKGVYAEIGPLGAKLCSLPERQVRVVKEDRSEDFPI